MKTNDRDDIQLMLKGFNLESPLFYNNEIGLRFELGVPYRDHDNHCYFETIHYRAREVFETVFSDTDEILLIMKTYQPMPPFEELNPGVNVFFNFVESQLANEVTCFEEIPDIDEDTNQVTGHYRSYSLLCSLSKVNYGGILTAIGYKDFPSYGEYISDRIHFIHPTKKVVFYMYDDRGLDVVSLEVGQLSTLYVDYNNWILDYDRVRIDKIFKI